MNIFNGDYRKLIAVPVIFTVIFLFLIFVSPGLTKGIDLDGGSRITVKGVSTVDAQSLAKTLEEKHSLRNVKVVPIGNGVIIEFSENEFLTKLKNQLNEARAILESNPVQARTLGSNLLNSMKSVVSFSVPDNASDEEFIEFVNKTFLKAKEKNESDLQSTLRSELKLSSSALISIGEVPPTFGKYFFDSALRVAFISIVFVIIVIFFFFREVIPSLAVVSAAFFDILGALAFMAFFSIPVNLSSITALLMLIGYSVDTDIMLTTRVLKRKEKHARERAFDAMKTGMTMTLTTVAAVSAMSLIAYFNQIVFIYEVAIVIFFGLIADIIVTWLFNAPLLLWYVEKKEKVHNP